MATACCLTCTHAALRDQADEHRDKALRRMAAFGVLNCSASPLRADFFPIGHCCKRHEQAAAEIIAAREAWARQQNLLP